MPSNQTAGGAESAAPAFNTIVASGERERDLDITSLVFLVYLLDSMDPSRVNVSYS